MLFSGSLLVTASYIGALGAALASRRRRGSGHGGAGVPGRLGAGLGRADARGLGATDATFAAALTTVGVGDADAVAGVLLYRLLMSWLPIGPGYLSYLALQRADRL